MSESILKLQSYFRKLKGYEVSPNNVGIALDLIQTIHRNCLHCSNTDKEKAYVCSNIFNKDYGILVFLQSVLQEKMYKIPKIESFKFLDDVLDNFQPSVTNYGVSIKKICLSYIKGETAADPKRSSLVTLSKVLEVCQGKIEDENMDINGMIRDLYIQLGQGGSKLQSTVKCEILCLLGVISHCYPQHFSDYSERVLQTFLREIKKQMNTTLGKRDKNVIFGCIFGLKEYMFNFTVSFTENEKTAYEIFSIICEVISEQFIIAKSYSMCKAGLQLLTAHASQFGLFLYDKAFDLYQKIVFWVQHPNRDMQKLGHAAIISFLKEVVEIMTSKINENKTSGIKEFNFFMNEFRSAFLLKGSRDFSIAVIGYGLFAIPCKLYLGEEEVQKMLIEMIQRSEHLCFNDPAFLEDRLVQLPKYLESLASIIAVINHVPDLQMFSLEKLVVFQIDNFPYVPSTFHYPTSKAVIRILLSMQPKEQVSKGFISRIVYQSLMRTCSHPIIADVETAKDLTFQENQLEENRMMEMKPKMITFHDYTYLWNKLLDVVQLKELGALGISLHDRQILKEAIYDEIINSIIALVNKLDLDFEKQDRKVEDAENRNDDSDTPNTTSDPIYGVKPKNLKDYHIFINIVDFSKELLGNTCIELFRKWVYVFGLEMVKLSTKHPYISGFYKMIALNLCLCKTTDYFEALKDENNIVSEGRTIIDEHKECLASFRLFSKFCREVTVRLKQFKDDLLSSCLQVLLALPTEIVKNEIYSLVPAIQNTFAVGTSYLPLARMGLCALSKWCEELPEIMKDHYPMILPCLNAYLTTSGISGEKFELISGSSKSSTKGSHKISARYMKLAKKYSTNNMAQDSEISKIQMDILHFLGGLGGKNNYSLLHQAYQEIEASSIAWDYNHRHHLKYSVPFCDMKPEVYFDDFLPRVLELATKCSDRHIKVTACEVLHSLVLYMVGRGSQMPESHKKKYSMELLYKNLFPGLLELACGVEQVSKQLFQPLVLQLIHWFSNSKVIQSKESSVVLHSLWEGVTHENDAALRDFSSICLKEFFSWSMKQAPLKEGKSIPIHIKNFFKKMCSYSQHPSACKRLGAALVFNNIYTLFRNELNLVKKYAMELLKNFVNSLAIAHNDDKSLGTQKQCQDALDHLGRILKFRSEHFCQASETVKKLECLGEATMHSIVIWLLKQCGCPQTERRHKCMDLVVQLSPLIPGVECAPNFFIQTYQLKNQSYFLEIFEEKINSLGVPPISYHSISLYSSIHWLEALISCLECYNWVISAQLLDPSMFDETYNYCVFKAVTFFIQEIAKKTLHEAITIFCDLKQNDFAFSPKETAQFDWSKGTTIIRVFEFFVIMQKNKSCFLSKECSRHLWNSKFWDIILLTTISPSSLGFEFTDWETQRNLALETTSILSACTAHYQGINFIKYCHQFLAIDPNVDLRNNIPVNIYDRNQDYTNISQLLSGYKILINLNIWPPEEDTGSYREEMIPKLLDSIWNDCAFFENLCSVNSEVPPVSFMLVKHILETAFALKMKAKHLVSKIVSAGSNVDSNGQSKMSKGMIIFSYYEQDICALASKISPEFVYTLLENLEFGRLSILQKLLNNVAAIRNLRRQYGSPIIHAVMSNWPQLFSWCEKHSDINSLYLPLSLMTKMLLIDSKVALNVSKIYPGSLFPAYNKILKKSGMKLDYKVSALDLLPFFLSVVDEELQELRSSLQSIIAEYFPTKSTELVVGSCQHNSYVSAIKKLLSALELTSNELVFKLLIIIFCKEDDHILEQEFQQSLLSLIKRLPPCNHQHFVEIPFNLTKSSSNLSPIVKFMIMERVCLPMLRHISPASFINFYCSNIKDVMNMTQEEVSMTTENIELQLVSQTSAFKLFELLYKLLPKELVHSKESQIVCAYVGDKISNGNELTRDITKFALTFKKANLKSVTVLKEDYRKMNCAAFNTLIAIISCTQNELKFYNCFLFIENISKGESLWENVIDGEKQYKFDIELDDSSVRKKKYVSIRHQVRIASNEASDSDLTWTLDSSADESSLHLMASENLALSSLAEEVSQFDFSTSELAFSSKIRKSVTRQSKGNGISFGYQKNEEQDYLEMDFDELNNHECMPALTVLLNHMVAIGLIPKTEAISKPLWLESIIQKLENITVSHNVKIFLGRVIINCNKILKPYGKFLLEPLMQLIISGTLGGEINYYILDVIITMLSWAPDAIPEDNLVSRHSASCILEFLMNHCSHSRRQIFRNNLEVIKTVLECWKSRLNINYRIIYNKLGNADAESKDNLVGLQLLGIIVSSDLPPCIPEKKSESQSYFSLLTRNISFKYKEVFASAAEVIGLSLKNLQKMDPELKEFLSEKVIIQLDDLSHESKKDKFLICLHKIHMFYPQIADKYIQKLLFMQASVLGVYQNYILEILCSRIKNIPDGYNQLKSTGMFEDILHKDETVQYLILKILENVFTSLSCDEILSILPKIVDIHSHPTAQCRLALYNLLMPQFDKYRMNEGAKEKEITRLAQETLLKGLSDPDSAVRLTLDNFWSSEARLPRGTKERLVALMKNMYSTSTESCFLQYATCLLLERTFHSPDYKRKVFEHPLSECNFQIYSISTSWRKQHAAMTPMFADSISVDYSSSLHPSNVSSMSFVEGKKNMIRATPGSFEFSANLDPSTSKVPFSWMTEKSIDTFSDGNSLEGLSSLSLGSSKSHLLTVVGPQKYKKSNSTCFPLQDFQAEGYVAGRSSPSNLQLLRRRFWRDKNEANAFAKNEIRRRDAREEIKKEQKVRREAQVTMYRHYRIGDLPDIEIENSAIIVPLQALAQGDATIAKMLFKCLLVSICEFVKSEMPMEYTQLYKEIGSYLSKILENSVQYVPTVISFCLESLHYLQNINIDPEIVYVASQASNQQSTGIMLLESKILQGSEEEPFVKRKRHTRQPINKATTYWIKLAELYKSVEEYDIVKGIFSQIMDHRVQNQRALVLETNGRYADAVSLYQGLYDEASEEFDQAEKDFWDNSILFCYDKLTSWKNLEKTVLSRFTDPESPDLQRVWEDAYYQVYYLPFMMRSKVKLLLDDFQDQSLLTFVDEATKDEEKKLLLEANFAEELALLYVIQEEYDAARYYNSACLQQFLKDWRSLSSLAIDVRNSKLQKLQKFIEMDEFLNIVGKGNSFNFETAMKLIKQWQKRLPSIVDPINVWDDMNANRHLYMRKLTEKYDSLGSDLLGNTRARYSEIQVDHSLAQTSVCHNGAKFFLENSVMFKLNMIKSTTAQGNIPVSIKHLKYIHQASHDLEDSIKSQFIEAYCETYHCKSLTLRGLEKLKPLVSSLDQLVKMENKCSLSVAQKILQSEALEMITNIFITEGQGFMKRCDELPKILQLTRSERDSEVVSNLLHKSFEILDDASCTELEFYKKKMHKNNQTSAHLRFATFCNNVLQHKESEEVVDCPALKSMSITNYPCAMSKALLTAMQYGSHEAVQLFPRLLEVLELYPQCQQSFKLMSSNVPCWMYIGWINQIMALLDKPEAVSVQNIVEDIVLQYPFAVVFSFRISSEAYQFLNTAEGKKNKAFAKRIKYLLSKLGLVEDFIEALGDLGAPPVIFKDFVQTMRYLICASKKNEAVEKFKEMWKVLFTSSERRIPHAPLFEKFLKTFSDDVKAICGKDGSKLLKNPKAYEEMLRIYNIAKSKDLTGVAKLANISPWLSDFQLWKFDDHIEIPGQYLGRSKPLPEYHVKIAGFDEKILILQSLTLPRRITILGNDEKEYKMLVKAGEDLRQDNRIQQLFSVMNDIYSKDPACGLRRLQLSTYKVIPISSRIGLIEWVDNSKVLNDFLFESVIDENHGKLPDSIQANAAKRKAQKWIGNKPDPIQAYLVAHMQKGRAESVSHFNEIVNTAPKGLLKRAFLKLSSSPEAFLRLRSNFAVSHAVICISQWVLGIGDRHLGNFLVSLCSGKEIGIDFGHAFGTATQFLPVPELVPFRLSSQYLQLMEPFQEKGLFEVTMVHILSALRNNSCTLLNIMNIFIKEPTVDWKLNSLKQQQQQTLRLSSTDEERDSNWYPKQRVKMVRQKLEGANPCFITREELRLGLEKKRKELFEKIVPTCLGCPEFNIRARLPASGLTAQEQVSCLIDQATDYHILAKTYDGWSPWM